MYADAGEITAHEIFRRDMAPTKLSFVQGPAVSESGNEMTRPVTPTMVTELPHYESDQKDIIQEAESEEEKSIPERDPDVLEVVMVRLQSAMNDSLL